MVKMIMNLMTLERDLKNVHDYMEHLASDFQGLKDNPVAVNLQGHLQEMEIRLHETICQWTELGTDFPVFEVPPAAFSPQLKE